ncbi:MAG: urease accessory protein UreF [Rhodospirillales bacterium]|nr:urease accessory protein UreF [Rhodospirillales bacterium]
MPIKPQTGILSDSGLYRLMAWLSPGFPVGAYAYSHGLEFAVEDGRVSDEDSLRIWIQGILASGAGSVDGPLFAAAWIAVAEGNFAALLEAAETADCFRATSEMALESSAQGEAFFRTARECWASEKFARAAEYLEHSGRPISYSIAVAVAAAAAEIPLRSSLIAYFHSVVANLTSAGVRLIPLGQTSGQRIIEALSPDVTDVALAAENTPQSDIGSAVPIIDWTSVRHETQYTRLFRS